MSGEVGNIYTAYNFSHFAIHTQKRIKIRDEVLTETKMHSFFETRYISSFS